MFTIIVFALLATLCKEMFLSQMALHRMDHDNYTVFMQIHKHYNEVYNVCPAGPA